MQTGTFVLNRVFQVLFPPGRPLFSDSDEGWTFSVHWPNMSGLRCFVIEVVNG